MHNVSELFENLIVLSVVGSTVVECILVLNLLSCTCLADCTRALFSFNRTE